MNKLSREQENALLDRIASGDNKAHDEIIAGHQWLVYDIARRYANRGVPFADLTQEGNRGLLRSLQKFDRTKGNRLQTYARWWILSFVQRAKHTQGPELPILESMRAKLRPIYRAERSLFQRLKRSATAEEIAEELSVPVEEVEERLALIRRRFSSLDAPVPGSVEFRAKDLSEITADPNAESPDAGAERESVRALLACSNDRLKPRERRALELRFGLADGTPRTLNEVGEEFEMTGEGARLIQVAALCKLRGIPPPKKKTKPLSLRVLKGFDTGPLQSTTDKGRIIESVCRAYGVSEEELRSKKRHGRIAWARKVAFYLLVNDLGMFSRTIAERFGEKPAVAVYAIKAVQSVSDQRWWQEDVAKIRALYESVLDLKIHLPSFGQIP